MKTSRYFNLLMALMPFGTVCLAEDTPPTAQATPALSGQGQTNHIAVWKSSTVLGSSGIVSTGGNVGIGTTTPAAKLEVNGDARVDGNLSMSGSIFVTGVSQLIWAPNDGSFNLGVGLGALPSNTTGDTNTAVGYRALSTNTSGYGNTALGEGTLAVNSGGNLNTAIGVDSMTSNSTGGQNTALGQNALKSNTIGNANTAGGSNALHFNTTGSFNTATGIYAMEQNINGQSNTATGYGALNANTAGNNNTAIGFQAGQNLTTTSNNIEIGNAGTLNDSGAIRIGTPGVQTSAFISGIYGAHTGINNAVPVLIDSNGNLGTVSSSRRYKEAIQNMGEASDGLMRLRPVTFRYQRAYEDGSKPVQYGLIAEEVAEVYPDLVAWNADGQVETVKYQLLDPMLLNELQKQHATIVTQTEQILNQQREIRSLEERLTRLEGAFGTLPVETAAR